MRGRRRRRSCLNGATHSKAATQLLLGAGVPVIEIWDVTQRPIEHATAFPTTRSAAPPPVISWLGPPPDRGAGAAGRGDARDFGARSGSAGFAATLKEIGQGDAPLVQLGAGAGPSSMAPGAGVAARARAESDAIFAVSDLSAVGALMECQTARYSGARGHLAHGLRRFRDRTPMCAVAQHHRRGRQGHRPAAQGRCSCPVLSEAGEKAGSAKDEPSGSMGLHVDRARNRRHTANGATAGRAQTQEGGGIMSEASLKIGLVGVGSWGPRSPPGFWSVGTS